MQKKDPEKGLYNHYNLLQLQLNLNGAGDEVRTRDLKLGKPPKEILKVL